MTHTATLLTLEACDCLGKLPIFTVDSLSNVGFSWVAATSNSARMLLLHRLCQVRGRKKALHSEEPWANTLVSNSFVI
jgi:hypothetical protein